MKIVVISYLCNIHHVSHESKAFQFELRDVSLQQYIYLKEKKTFYRSENLFL